MEILKKPEELFSLANKIIKKHTDEGANSPLPKMNIAKMSFKLHNAQDFHNMGKQYQELARQAFEERVCICDVIDADYYVVMCTRSTQVSCFRVKFV